MDAKELPDVSSIPINAAADSNRLINDTMSTIEAPYSSSVTNSGVAPVTESSPAGREAPEITNSIEKLSIGTKDEGPNDALPAGDSPLESAGSDEKLSTLDDISGVSSNQPNHTDSPLQAASQNGDSVYSSSNASERRSCPSSVTSPKDEDVFSNELPHILCNPVDQPDPRLIDALGNPRDRIFVIKLEKDIVDFIEDKTCETFDMPPINSYHRLLAHKLAEYYHLTHVADASGSSVRIFRGQAARIPNIGLSAWPVPAQQQQKAATSGVVPAVKIMRRGASDKDCGSPSRDSSTPRKAGSETSSENDNSNSTVTSTSNSTKTTREEREQAYQEARARIFKDFVESPPETPPPSEHKKSRRKDQNDDFSGRSQFYPVMTQPMPHPTHYYPQQGYDPSMLIPSTMQPYPLAQHQAQAQGRFNPTANFTPSAGFSPSAPPFVGQPMTRSFPPYNPNSRDRGYPQPQQQHPQQQYPQQQHPQQQHPQQQHPQQQHPQQQHPQQQIYPQQRNGFYPNQSPPALNGTYNPHPQAQMMQSSYSSNGFPHQQQGQQQGGHPMMQAQFNPALTPPPSRQPQPQSQQYPMPNPQYGNNLQPQQQRLPTQFPGWGSTGGVPMPRSSSAPGHPGGIDGGTPPMTNLNGFSGGMVWGGQGGWNGGGAVGRGNGAAGGGPGMMRM